MQTGEFGQPAESFLCSQVVTRARLCRRAVIAITQQVVRQCSPPHVLLEPAETLPRGWWGRVRLCLQLLPGEATP